MKNALKRLQGRARGWWHLTQARSAIARCNRAVERRSRIGVPLKRVPVKAPYFAPGIIDPPPRGPRPGMAAYVTTIALAIAAALVYVLGGLFA